MTFGLELETSMYLTWSAGLVPKANNKLNPLDVDVNEIQGLREKLDR